MAATRAITRIQDADDFNGELVDNSRLAWSESDGFTLVPPVTGSGGLTFAQDVPSTLWDVQHNLGRLPSVTIIGADGKVELTDVTYIDDTRLRVDFLVATAGKALLA